MLDVTALAPLGADAARYGSFEYEAIQAIAAAAHFLEFDGLIAPSARHASLNLAIFIDREAARSLVVESTEDVDWAAWRMKGVRS
jgi:hypothetical protein